MEKPVRDLPRAQRCLLHLQQARSEITSEPDDGVRALMGYALTSVLFMLSESPNPEASVAANADARLFVMVIREMCKNKALLRDLILDPQGAKDKWGI